MDILAWTKKLIENFFGILISTKLVTSLFFFSFFYSESGYNDKISDFCDRRLCHYLYLKKRFELSFEKWLKWFELSCLPWTWRIQVVPTPSRFDPSRSGPSRSGPKLKVD